MYWLHPTERLLTENYYSILSNWKLNFQCSFPLQTNYLMEKLKCYANPKSKSIRLYLCSIWTVELDLPSVHRTMLSNGATKTQLAWSWSIFALHQTQPMGIRKLHRWYGPWLAQELAHRMRRWRKPMRNGVGSRWSYGAICAMAWLGQTCDHHGTCYRKHPGRNDEYHRHGHVCKDRKRKYFNLISIRALVYPGMSHRMFHVIALTGYVLQLYRYPMIQRMFDVLKW